MDADDALRIVMDGIYIDSIEDVRAVRLTPVGLKDLAEVVADAVKAARAEGEAAGYRRAIDDACFVLDNQRFIMWATSVSVHEDRAAGHVREVMRSVRKLAPVKPVSKADKLPGAPKGGV